MDARRLTTIEELHMRAAQGDHHADLLTLAELETAMSFFARDTTGL